MSSSFNKCLMCLGILMIAFILEPFSSIAVKPLLDVDEIILETSLPALTGGRKDAFGVLQTQTAVSSVSETLRRLDTIAPNLIPAPDQPGLQPQGGCLAPFLRIGSSTNSRMFRASQAWEKMSWNDVAESLQPIADHKEDIPEKPVALYFIGRSRHYLHDTESAAKAYEKLISQFPNHQYSEFALYSLSWIYFEDSQIERAMDTINTFDLRFAASPLTPYVRFLRAAILNSQEKYQDSLRSLEGIIDGYPMFENLSEVQFWIAENYYYLERYADAEKTYGLYLSNYPGGNRRPEAYYGRAFSRLELDRLKDALNDLELIVNQYPDHYMAPHSGFLGGKVAIFLEEYTQATQFFHSVLSAYPSSSPRFLEAQAWIDYTGGRYESAADLFRAAADAYPDSLDQQGQIDANRAEMLFFEAVSLMQNEDFASAASKFEDLTRQAPSPWKASSLANAGICRLSLNQPEIALQHFKTALTDQRSLRNKHLYQLYKAESLYRVGFYDESIALFKKLQTIDELSKYRDEIIRGIAWNYYAERNWNKASEYFGRLVQQYPDSVFHPEALLRQAESLFNSGEFEYSKLMFQSLITQYPLHPEAFEARLLKARADWVRSNYESGYQGFMDALRYAPDAAHRQKVRMIIGELQQEQEKYMEAIDTFHLAYLDDPDGDGASFALLRKADNYYNLQKDEDALAIYRQIVDTFPESEAAGFAQYSIGLIYFRQDRLDDYLQECLTISRTRPGTRQSALALNGAASILIERNRYAEAADILRVLKDRYMHYLDEQLVYFRLGQTLFRDGQLMEAQTALDDLIQKAPKGRYAADAYMELANIALKDNDMKQALDYMEHVILHFVYHPRRLEAIRKSAEIFYDKQQWDQSERLWMLFIEETGQSSEVFSAHLALGWVMFHAENLDAARKHAEISRRSAHRNVLGEAQLLIGKINEKQGNRDEALKEYMRIGYVYPDQPDIVFRALLRAVAILVDQGNTSQANSVLRRAAGLVRNSEQRQLLLETEQLTGLSGGLE